MKKKIIKEPAKKKQKNNDEPKKMTFYNSKGTGNANEIDKKAKKNNKDDVFERLNSENFRKKHNEEIQKIAVKNNKNKNPEINKSSQKIKRNIQDLYQWKNKIDTKKQENINNINERLNEERFIKTNKKSKNHSSKELDMTLDLLKEIEDQKTSFMCYKKTNIASMNFFIMFFSKIFTV